MALMKDLVHRLEPGDMVLDGFAGNLRIAKMRQLLDKYRQFVGCEKDGSCMETSMAGLVEFHAGQLLNNKANSKGGDELMEATWGYLSGVKSQKLKQWLDSWGAPRGLTSVKTFQKYVCCIFAHCIGTT